MDSYWPSEITIDMTPDRGSLATLFRVDEDLVRVELVLAPSVRNKHNPIEVTINSDRSILGQSRQSGDFVLRGSITGALDDAGRMFLKDSSGNHLEGDFDGADFRGTFHRPPDVVLPVSLEAVRKVLVARRGATLVLKRALGTTIGMRCCPRCNRTISFDTVKCWCGARAWMEWGQSQAEDSTGMLMRMVVSFGLVCLPFVVAYALDAGQIRTTNSSWTYTRKQRA